MIVALFIEDSLRYRADNAIVTASEIEDTIMYTGDDSYLCNKHDGLLEQYYTLIICSQPITGQYVQIQFDSLYYPGLNLYEVEVHGV